MPWEKGRPANQWVSRCTASPLSPEDEDGQSQKTQPQQA